MSFLETQARWDNFLTKIKEKFDEIMSKSEEALPLVFEHTDLETTIFLNAWRGMYHQALDLITKIEHTWHGKVREAFLDLGLEDDSEEFISERSKGYQMGFELEQALKTHEVHIFAKAANKLLDEVKNTLSKDFSCSQCQANFPVKDNFFRSYYQTCTYCQTVNTFEPGIKARNIEHFAMDALGEEAALSHYLAHKELEFQNFLTDKEINSKDKLIEVYRKYVESFLKKRIEIIPDYADRYDRDLEAKVSFLEKYS